MEALDYIILFVLDYLLIGIFKVVIDIGEPNPSKRPIYAGHPSCRMLCFAAFAWPLSVYMYTHHQIKMRRFGLLIKKYIMNIILIMGLYIWTRLSYLLAGYLAQSRFFRTIITIPILLIFIFLVAWVIGRKRRKGNSEKLIDRLARS